MDDSLDTSSILVRSTKKQKSALLRGALLFLVHLPMRRDRSRKFTWRESSSHPPTVDLKVHFQGAGSEDIRAFAEILVCTLLRGALLFLVYPTQHRARSRKFYAARIEFASSDRRSESSLSRRRERGYSDVSANFSSKPSCNLQKSKFPLVE